MRKPSNLRPYRREIINLRNDEKTFDQIAKYLAQEYSIDASADEIRDLIQLPHPTAAHTHEAK